MDGISSGKILSFNTKSVLKCQEALRIRKKKLVKIWTRYPSRLFTINIRYHLDCYKKFTTLGKTHRKNLPQMTETLPPKPENKIIHSSSKVDKTNRVGDIS